MKILFLTHTFDNGGVEKNTFQLISTFKKVSSEPIDIRVISLIGGGSFFDPSFCKILMPFNLPIQKMRKSKILLYLIVLFFSPLLLWKLKKEIKNFSPDSICTNMWLSDIMAAAATKRIRIISIQHDIVKINPIITYFKIRALKHVEKVIAISYTVKDFLIKYFKVSENKIEIIYNGIDYDKFLAGQKENTNQPLVFGTIARLDKIKGHIHVLEALKILKQQNITPKYIIVGSGPEENILHTFVKENNLTNVQFIKEVLDVVPLLKEIDVFIFPSLSEGLGIAVIEALIAKKLIIASDIGAMQELIKNNETGLLIDPQNTQEWSKAIEWAINNQDKVNIIRDNSYEWIKQNKNDFNTINSAHKYLDVFLNPKK